MKLLILLLCIISCIVGSIMFLSEPLPNQQDWDIKINLIGALIAWAGGYYFNRLIKSVD